MPKNENQKLKLYYLYKIMLEKTDDNHSLTMPEILQELEKYGITAERKSICAGGTNMSRGACDDAGQA